MDGERGIEPGPAGGFEVVLPDEERNVLAALPGQLLEALDAGEPTLYRLFPPAHVDDAAANLEYRQLVQQTLEDGKRAALSALAQTAHETRLTGDELRTWLGAVESLRLALGTQLDVGEDTHVTTIDPADADAPRQALYQWLSWLQDAIVEALSADLAPQDDD